jgi:transposase-like protein
MDVRTCPHCNYKYSIAEYRNQVLLTFLFSEWNCKNCHKKITIDYKRRLIIALAFIGLYIFIMALRNTRGLTHVLWADLLILCSIVSFFVFAFDSFKKAE